ncbi:DUF6873 family GME fold protein [Lutispora thermophila]|uniref:DUF6873 domain-containing protein n=1 Tax=Lutispora thermophila DSM 19022 TaxID=1122184 RepID=A0A1M6GMX4_9FIRM|nr:hypothetical protein [Lutispora thermophila]SHJ11304.1 hypothetical protein SAMN02745176_02439 [Lutispora thermophila DSM 19022]
MSTFLENPNLPQNKVKIVVLDYRTDDEILSNLSNMGIEIIRTERCFELYEAIDGHPDILMHHVGGNSLVIAPNIYDKVAERFHKKGFALTKGATWLQRNYPQNIAYNVLRLGKLAFHNTKYTDPEIIRIYEKNDVRLVHVNQGYTKCSVCIIDENSVITHDIGVARVMEKHGIEVLVIEPGGIDIIGLNYGFIGGTSGLISKNTIVFTGSMKEMKCYNKILEYVALKGIDIKILSNKKIMDIGSIMPLSY